MITDAKRTKAANKNFAVTGISVTDQITWSVLPTAGFRELIGDPLGSRMRRYAEPQNLSPAVAHDQRPIEQPERDGRHHEQIHRGDFIRMTVKKGPPSLRRGSAPACHVFGDACLPYIDTELEQFAVNTRYSP